MKGYKGFKKGLICEGEGYRKQYEVGKTYEEDEAIPCEKGMHFCKNILDVLDYYPLIDDDGDLNEFCEVEALDDPKTDDNKKWASKKLKIVKKLSFQEFINIAVSYSGDWSKLDTSGDWSKLAASGDWSQLSASGDWSKLAASGDWSQLSASGNESQLAASGDWSKLAASGDWSQLAASGDWSKLAASGDWSKLAASGDWSKLAASGYGSKLAASGEGSVIANIGIGGKAKGSLGCWITLAEYDGERKPICVKTEIVDGDRIKADTWYQLVEGEFKEV